MAVCSFSSYAIFIVALLAVGLSRLKEVAATHCVGPSQMLYPGLQYDSHKQLVVNNNEINTLISPACLQEYLPAANTPSLNISATVYTQWDTRVILIGNITGSGSLRVTNGNGEVLLDVTGASAKESVVYPDNHFDITYSTSHWAAGDGALVQLYAASTLDGCLESRRVCEVDTTLHQYICLPSEWACNGRSECSDGLDESDCLGCCTQQGRYSVWKSTTNCWCNKLTTTNSQRHYHDGECNGISQTIPRSSQSSLQVNIPYFGMPIPYNVTYHWSRVSASSMSFTYHSVAVVAGDIITLSIGNLSYNLNNLRSDESRLMPLNLPSSNISLNIVIKSPHSVYDFTCVFIDSHPPLPKITSEPAVPRGASKCEPIGMGLYVRKCDYKGLCARPEQVCDGYMDCPNGKDELGCGSEYNECKKDEILCPESSPPRCFTMAERCDGSRQCTASGYDEKNCDSTMCGTHNGTFLCTDNTCIFETWLCDKAQDCPHNADEQNCDGTTLKVVTASVIGSLVCAIMMVIAIGCFCKLHTHRMYENLNQRSRYESPMSRITNELMRRAAPPPYAEAMQRSRPFEEVQNEYLAALEQRRRVETREENEEEMHEEQSSVASASGTIDQLESSLVQVAEENTVSFRRNPNKPTDSAQPDEDPRGCTNAALDPKSDDETGLNGDVPQTPLADNTPRDTQTRRQALRRISLDSDVSLLSRDSDDVALLS